MKSLYEEDLKLFTKVAKVDLTKWKVSPVYSDRKFNILKMYALSKLIYKINVISMKILMYSVKQLDKIYVEN